MIMQRTITQSIQRTIVASVIISTIVGGLVGGLAGVVVSGWSQQRLWPALARTFGIHTQDMTPGSSRDADTREQTVMESSAAIDVVRDASPAVVSVIVTQDLSALYSRTGPFSFDDFFFGFPHSDSPSSGSGKQEVAGGTGFIVTTDGMILTNRHVVDQEDAEYSVVLSDGERYEAVVLARDDLNDIAILKVEADNLPVLDLGDSDTIQIGQTVIAIGNSLGEFSNTVTKGVVSGINRRVVAGDSAGFSEVIEEAIQTDAAINPGNSGGPLLDLFGKVIGVNTAVSREGQLIGFAIPINAVKNSISSVQEHGRIVRPFLGVRYILLNEKIAEANGISDITSGALVVRGEERTDLAVVPGSPADKAGLVENDIILEVNGEKITYERGLARVIAEYAPQDTIKMLVYHRGEELMYQAVLDERE